MERVFIMCSATAGFTGVALGAFGAHALRDKLAPDLQAIYQTAVQYHLLHAVVLGVCAWVVGRWPNTAAQIAGWLFVAGIVLFSGSLYVLALTGMRWLGAVTPLGGLCFLGGWLALAIAAWR